MYANDVSTLAEGDARVAVRHTAATGPVDVLAGGSPIIEGLANPDEEQLDLPAGDYSVTVNEGGSADVLAGPVDLTLEAGVSYLVHAVGDPAADTFTLLVQTIEGLSPDAQLWAVMSGDEEVPPVDTGAAGVATFEVSEDGTEVTFKVIAWYLEDITMGHIHVAPAGANGPIVAVLVDFAPLDATSGETRNGLLAEGTIAAADVAADPDAGFDGSIGALVRAMRSEGSYVNIHTVANPSGEIRGQITTLPNGVEDRFTDDDGSVHEGNIDIIAAADITLGCDEADPSLFCPSETGDQRSDGVVHPAGAQSAGGRGPGVHRHRRQRARGCDRCHRRCGDHDRLRGRNDVLPERAPHPRPDGIVPGPCVRVERWYHAVHRHRGEHPRGQHRRHLRGGDHPGVHCDRVLPAGPGDQGPDGLVPGPLARLGELSTTHSD